MLIRPTVAGVILAGGLSRRMGGGDKALKTLEGRSILEHVIDRVGPQVRMLALNANGDPVRFEKYGLPVVSDSIDGFAGPLAGVLACRISGGAFGRRLGRDLCFPDIVERIRAGVTAHPLGRVQDHARRSFGFHRGVHNQLGRHVCLGGSYDPTRADPHLYRPETPDSRPHVRRR